MNLKMQISLILALLAINLVRASIFDTIVDANEQEKQKFAAEKQPELFEGDILVSPRLKTTIQKMNLSARGYSSFNAKTNGAWPRGKVAYVFAASFNKKGRDAVEAGIADYHRLTCIKFVPRTNENNYIYFYHGRGCASYIGIQSGRQDITLGYRCLIKGIAMHEMMHALGFFHEQSRLDRDDYITVNEGNVRSAALFNFQKYRPGDASNLGEPYDKQSIMHYGNYAFAKSRSTKTIISKADKDEKLGQRDDLSDIDVKQLNKYYHCNKDAVTKPKPKPTPKPTQRPMPKSTECRKDASFCSSLSVNYCKDDLIKNRCQEFCGVCKVCEDIHKNCPAWARSYCKDSKYGAYMTKNCQKSCKFCQ